MKLIKTSLLNSIAVAVKMLTLLGLNKLLAVYVGPSGYAVIGQFQNAMQMITTFASGAINTGVTKYTAEYFDDEARQRTVWSTAGTIALAGSLFTSVLIAIFCKPLATLVLKDERYSGVFIWFSCSLTLFVINSLLLAILNGKKEIYRYVIANITGSLFALVVTSVLAIYFALYGALVALATFQSMTFIVTLVLCWKSKWFRANYLVGKIDGEVFRNLMKFAAMALATAVSVPLSHILIRDIIIEQSSMFFAGLWEALMRISFVYLTFVSTVFSIYFVPKFSELRHKKAIKKEVNCSILTMGIFCLCTMPIIYLLRSDIVSFLFSEKFIEVEHLIKIQIIGDFFKVISFVFAYFAIARGNARYFIFGEIFFSLVFVLLVKISIPGLGIVSTTYSYVLTYFLYMIYMFFGYIKYYNKFPSEYHGGCYVSS